MPNRNQQQTQNKQQTQTAGQQRSLSGQLDQQTTYWREQYKNEPYYSQGEKFEQYEPAYRAGIEGRQQYAGQRFDEVESNLRNDYEAHMGSGTMTWDNKARQACRAAWDHADQSMSSGTDRQQGGKQSQSGRQPQP